ncbi:MAG: virulence RhuM family protein [Candidatus Gracilibacteria bacterium]|nr:virulence RhuM family protein [Candidatus Gracilibacteria bacterium]
MNAEITTLSDFVLYNSPEGEVKLQVFLQDETLWLTQKMMAELFDVSIPTINEHLKNIFESGELSKKATVRNFLIVQKEGSRKVSREIEYYNLDAIISVGYRVNSARATQFRIWATQVLKEYIVKGFAMDDERLKQGEALFEKDYFAELLERVRSIRASERRMYLKITDIFAECSLDYDSNSDLTKEFFATVQNKFHYAITGQTAAEIIHSKADKDKPYMGLSTWKKSSKDRILSSDVKVAKNYLSAKEIKKLERTISSFFDYIENLIEKRHAFTMEEFAESVNKFLDFNEYRILDGKGKISMSQAEKKALKEYQEFNKTQKIESDFEKEVKKMLKGVAKE